MLCPLPLSVFLHPLLVFCGYVTVPTACQRGKRKKPDLPSAPPPAKTSFRSTECLLLSLIRQGTCDETESPMREVLSRTLQSRLVEVKGGGDSQFSGSCSSLRTVVSMKRQTRSFSLETILDDSVPLTQQQCFSSSDSLESSAFKNASKDDSPPITTQQSGSDFLSRTSPITCQNTTIRNQLSAVSIAGLSGSQRSRPRSVGSCLDVVKESREEEVWQGKATSCLNVNAPSDQPGSSSASHPPSCQPFSSSCHSASTFSPPALAKAQGSHAAAGQSGPRPACSVSDLTTLHTPAVVRRCISSLDVFKPPRPVSLFKRPVSVHTSSSQSSHSPQSKPEHSKIVSPQSVCLLV